MSKIVYNLSQDIKVSFDVTEKTIKTNEYLGTGGITLQYFYSFCKEVWKTDKELIKYSFPWNAITAERIELVNGWSFKDRAQVGPQEFLIEWETLDLDEELFEEEDL